MAMVTPFLYVGKYTGILADGGSQQFTIQFANDSQFELREIRTTGASRLYCTIQFSNGALLSTVPFDCGLLGAGLNGWRLIEPITIPASAQLVVTFTNNSGAAITNPEIQFIGKKY